MNTLNRIRANKGPDRSNDGAVYSNAQASGLPADGTYYEFTVEPVGGTDRNFSNVSFPGPMRILLATGGDCFFTGDHYSTFQPVYKPGAAMPTIGSFSDNPSSVTVGASTTLTASNVTESGGTISSVKFYRESNGSSGLQIGSDTLVGTGSQNGSTWTLSASTSGFAAGNYTYYAVATDGSNINSSPASTTLSVTSPVGNPTIGAFSASPSTVTVGGSTVLTASNVTESGGTLSNVSFYRESNGTTGLQIGSDTLIGKGSQSGSNWSIAASTSGLAVGNYTYYAVATDTTGAVSSAASTIVTVTNPTTSGKVLDWNVSGQTNFGAQGLIASSVASSVTNSLGLTRGAGVSTSGSAASNAWGGSNWASSASSGISGNQFVTFGLTVNSGSTLSLSSLDMNYRRSGTGATSGYWQYQLNGGSWATIGDFANQFSSTSTSGASIPEINLAGVGSLQSLPGGTAVTFRVTPYGATSSGGTWYIYGTTGNDLLVNGSSTAGAKAAQVFNFPALTHAASPFNDALAIGESDQSFFESQNR